MPVEPLPRLRKGINLDAIAKLDPEDTARLRESYTAAIQPILDASHTLPAMLRGIGATIRPFVAKLNEARSSIEGIGAMIKASNFMLRDGIRGIVQQGWFIDSDMDISSVIQLGERYSSGQEAEAEAVLVAYYQAKGDIIVSRVCANAPDRAQHIQDAWDAHKAGKYTLSVPVFLIQADGIVYDRRSGRQLFSKRNDRGIGTLAKTAEDGSADWVFLAPYAEDSPFSKDTKDLPADFEGLNRHAVLHGISTKFATEVNSLRALSALGYVDFAL
jgi:hypothetical protein